MNAEVRRAKQQYYRTMQEPEPEAPDAELRWIANRRAGGERALFTARIAGRTLKMTAVLKPPRVLHGRRWVGIFDQHGKRHFADTFPTADTAKTAVEEWRDELMEENE